MAKETPVFIYLLFCLVDEIKNIQSSMSCLKALTIPDDATMRVRILKVISVGVLLHM